MSGEPLDLSRLLQLYANPVFIFTRNKVEKKNILQLEKLGLTVVIINLDTRNVVDSAVTTDKYTQIRNGMRKALTNGNSGVVFFVRVSAALWMSKVHINLLRMIKNIGGIIRGLNKEISYHELMNIYPNWFLMSKEYTDETNPNNWRGDYDVNSNMVRSAVVNLVRLQSKQNEEIVTVGVGIDQAVAYSQKGIIPTIIERSQIDDVDVMMLSENELVDYEKFSTDNGTTDQTLVGRARWHISGTMKLRVLFALGLNYALNFNCKRLIYAGAYPSVDISDNMLDEIYSRYGIEVIMVDPLYEQNNSRYVKGIFDWETGTFGDSQITDSDFILDDTYWVKGSKNMVDVKLESMKTKQCGALIKAASKWQQNNLYIDGMKQIVIPYVKDEFRILLDPTDSLRNIQTDRNWWNSAKISWNRFKKMTLQTQKRVAAYGFMHTNADIMEVDWKGKIIDGTFAMNNIDLQTLQSKAKYAKVILTQPYVKSSAALRYKDKLVSRAVELQLEDFKSLPLTTLWQFSDTNYRPMVKKEDNINTVVMLTNFSSIKDSYEIYASPLFAKIETCAFRRLGLLTNFYERRNLEFIKMMGDKVKINQDNNIEVMKPIEEHGYVIKRGSILHISGHLIHMIRLYAIYNMPLTIKGWLQQWKDDLHAEKGKFLRLTSFEKDMLSPDNSQHSLNDMWATYIYVRGSKDLLLMEEDKARILEEILKVL